MTRKSKREIERRLEEFNPVDEGMTLVELLSYEIETVDAERGLVRIVEKDELRKMDPESDPITELFGPEI